MTAFTERRSVRAAAAVLALTLAVVIGLVIGKGAQPDRPAQEPGGPQRLSASDVGFAQDMMAHHQQALQMWSSCSNPTSAPTSAGPRRRSSIPRTGRSA
ncbi:DUF305 domain-containing protein [Tsukamurella tyrosinosolvens]|uniref:DUF305 domain-containing protein n=1 Tax=Tsukamurella tyrosinosolvens TaxID=57704 RepID=UPI0007999786|nr:DUF305 domain-containing protein [Tsukamurella tyrosinosolvens]KXP02397.1 hypothetical protein AXK59_17825 [Tsukamurella tyrosinosolvens]KZL96535.1 hypothetical protein AXX05_13460 [Tsukamurella tyrosinosolvens]MCA4996424.1 DUF305 domain-containing protein [Tsukamurella tyrosinosolvens]WEL93795.1 DUF305 domain-containing protein [Tsukamurella tyrosinosolvens]